MKLTILPDNKVVEVAEGENLQKAIFNAGIPLARSCGGRGTCGKCKVNIVSGTYKGDNGAPVEGEVLSCRTTVYSDAVVDIPNDGRRISSHKVLINEIELASPFPFAPVFRKFTISLEPPSLSNNSDDLSRLMMELRRTLGYEEIHVSLEIMKKLPTALREGNWQITIGLGIHKGCIKVLSIEAGNSVAGYYGLAIDIGTTTVKINLVDLRDGKIVSSRGDYNRQQQYGDDVINRIIHSAETVNGIQDLQDCVVDSINGLIEDMVKQMGIKREDIFASVVSGNTTMIHLFLGIPANHLRLEPYIPAASVPDPVKAQDIGLSMHPEGIVYCLPAVGSYVGGDITAGVLATQIHHKEEIALLIDIGTNGEIVLGNQDWQMSCAASAGPCFEGGGIKYGMRAMDGAIDKIDIDGAGEVSVSTIGSQKPIGICGSGLIDTIATLLEMGLINRTGQFNKHISNSRLRAGEEGWEYVLVWGNESANGDDIVIMETDIENLIRAKAAIFAGIRSLLNQVAVQIDDISEIMIAGGFGNSLNIQDAITIGMLPDAPVERYRYVGNSALKGAQMVLTSKQALEEIYEFSKGMTYLELSVSNDYMDEYVSASFLPHTDLSLFPSLNK